MRHVDLCAVVPLLCGLCSPFCVCVSYCCSPITVTSIADVCHMMELGQLTLQGVRKVNSVSLLSGGRFVTIRQYFEVR